jgi:nucleotide-binding universal stress UspA family protein
VYAIEPRELKSFDPQCAAHDLATAEIAVRQAFTAIESLEEPVKVEVEILQNRSAQALVESSRRAVMICVGGLGLNHAAGRTLGSTAAALAAHAHCRLAIVRRCERSTTGPGWIVVEVDDSPESSVVLEEALNEATPSRSPAARADHLAIPVHRHSRHQRRCRQQPVGSRPSATATRAVELPRPQRGVDPTRVIGQQRQHGIAELVGPGAHAVLHDSNCSVLICERHSGL